MKPQSCVNSTNHLKKPFRSFQLLLLNSVLISDARGMWEEPSLREISRSYLQTHIEQVMGTAVDLPEQVGVL